MPIGVAARVMIAVVHKVRYRMAIRPSSSRKYLEPGIGDMLELRNNAPVSKITARNDAIRLPFIKRTQCLLKRTAARLPDDMNVAQCAETHQLFAQSATAHIIHRFSGHTD